VNAVIKLLDRGGLGGRHTYTLTVKGRRTGLSRSTPVRLIEDRERWLVAPYGEVAWVRNARAAGEVEVSRRGRTQRLRIEQVPPHEAAPVLKEYLKQVTVVRPFFDVKHGASLAEIAAEAPRHPVFRLTPL